MRRCFELPQISAKNPGGADDWIIDQVDAAEAEDIQAWLEETYEAVDYEDALQRAGCLSESESEQGEVLEEDFVADESEMHMDGEDSICEGKERELTYGEVTDISCFFQQG
eukprot:93719-Hanusia_phi.AAC.4